MRCDTTGKFRRGFASGIGCGLLVLLACTALPSIHALAQSAARDTNSSKPNLTLDQYETEMDRLASAVSVLPQHPEQIGDLRISVPPGWQVEAGGEKYDVSAAWLASALEEIEKHPAERKALCEEATEQLRSLRAEAGKADVIVVGANRTDARARLDKILSQREYLQVHQASWLSKVWDQVERWIDWLLDHTLGRLMGEGAVRTTVLYIIMIAVFLCAAVWLVRSLGLIVRSESLRVDAVFPPGKHWRDWAREALTAATMGDYRAALHAAYWAGVYRLAELGAWQLDRARTPREYLRMLDEQRTRGEESGYIVQPQEARGAGADRDPAARTAALSALTRSMEASWYGYLPATRQDFDNAVNHLEKLGCRLRSTVQTANS